PSRPSKSFQLKRNRFHSGPAMKVLMTGVKPRAWLKTNTEAVLPSPLAQNESPVLAERLAGVIVKAPGEKKTPAHCWPGPAAMVPVAFSACREPSAPPSTTVASALDLPPMKASVETIQPAPKAVLVAAFSPSKSLIRPASEPGGAGALFAFLAASLSECTRER